MDIAPKARPLITSSPRDLHSDSIPFAMWYAPCNDTRFGVDLDSRKEMLHLSTRPVKQFISGGGVVALLHDICQICGKGFMNRNHHDNHTFTHLKEKPFPCALCSKRLLTKSNLQRHRQSCRQISKNHQCVLCGKRFITETNLIHHQSQVHKNVKC